jgi:ligand-binding sensor domain-containing protein/two-component sensor histidine kinase
MKSRRLLTFMIIIITVCSNVRSVVADVILFDDSKGLSNSSVSALAKDKTGLFWIGTENGLNTFDGYSFNEIPFFKGAKIEALTYDSLLHQLWLATDKGLFWVNLADMEIVDCTAKIKEKEIYELLMVNHKLYVFFANGNIIEIDQEKHCTLIFGLYKLGLKNTTISHSIATDNRGFAYVIPHDLDRLVAIELKTGKSTVLNEINGDDTWNTSSGNGFILLSKDDGGFMKLSHSRKGQNSFVYTHSADNDKLEMVPSLGYLNYATSRSTYVLKKYEVKSNKWSEVFDKDSRLLKSKSIFCIYKDEQNVLWIGTNKGLIKYYEDIKFPFKLLFHDLSAPVSMRQITEVNNNEMYIGTYLGIFRYNNETRESYLLKNDSADSTFPLYTRALYYNSAAQYLYAGTESHTHFFYRYNIVSNKFETDFFKVIPATVKINSVYAIYADTKGILWLATDKGLASYNNKNKTLTLHVKDIYSVGDIKLYALAKGNKRNQFWAAGRGGLFLLDINNGVLNEWNTKKEPGLTPDDYLFVSEDSQNRVWLGSKKSGLKYLSSDYKTINTIDKSEGLSHNEVYSILWQNDSIGWISTANGLCRYNSNTQTLYNFFTENGIGDNEFNQNAFLMSKNGCFYFGGVNGITKFDPELIGINAPVVNIFGATISKWNKAIQSFSLVSGTDIIRMGPNDHLLTFGFGLSDYTETESNTYFYKIKGLYNDWISLGTQNVLRLEGLPAGNYTVEIIGFSKKGVRSANTLVYRVFIEQVYYKTGWFFVFLALGFVLIVYAYFKWRLRNIHQKQKLRIQIASNLHDEVGSLLTSITISTDNARLVAQTLEEKNIRLEKISSLSRNATNTMSDVLWSIDARNDYAGNLTDRMREHAESMLQPLQIDVQFDFTETQQNQNINPNIRQQLYLIFKEAIHNIVKHSQATIVKVYYKQQGTSFELRIQNNNAQKMEEHKNMGQGLKNMKMRANNIKATCLLEAEDGCYTVIIKSLA